ncbi:T9SS type A sorting domain-containing protein [Chryseobacterium indoltheticum]|uniref:T9SS type A sorting domain-containing protein n=1 Tax=Chryseobacterium indoltheticum TaxID=254 RepID=UPI001913FC25|nr:T9SS type A sorting domain-containing protein [Chryseobacterium indoltheticum]QQQ26981.1 T9SS type A sorting domain-containing protein [Chryseobacterium indoltheticum]
MKKVLFSAFALMVSSSAFSQYWSTQNTGFSTASRGISGMEVSDANTAWAFAYDGVTPTNNVQEFTKTSNGGTTWTSGAINVGNPALTITNISGVSGTTAWVGALLSTSSDGLGAVYKTVNGGTTWIAQQAFSTAGESYLNFVHAFDANNVIVGGDPENAEFELYTTSNGGSSWTRVLDANLPNPNIGEYGYNAGYYAVGNNIFFYTNKGRIYKSTDKGLNWTIAFTGSTYSLTDFGGATVNGDMAWSDANRGIVFKRNFLGTTPTALAIYRTTDGGQTWSTVMFTGITAANNINDITYVPGTNILVATSSSQTTGGSWKSLDNGSTWTALDTGVQHLNVRCSDASTCYSGGFNTSATVGGMFKSSQNLGVADTSKAINVLSMYPNPTKGEVNIKTDKKIKSTTVLDLSGKVIATGSSEKANLNGFTKGTYLITVEFADGSTKTEKIIKD